MFSEGEHINILFVFPDHLLLPPPFSPGAHIEWRHWLPFMKGREGTTSLAA